MHLFFEGRHCTDVYVRVNLLKMLNLSKDPSTRFKAFFELFPVAWSTNWSKKTHIFLCYITLVRSMLFVFFFCFLFGFMHVPIFFNVSVAPSGSNHLIFKCQMTIKFPRLQRILSKINSMLDTGCRKYDENTR